VLVCTLPLLLTRADKCTVDPRFLTFRAGLKTVAFNLSGRAFSNAELTGEDMSCTHLSLPTSLTTENHQQPSRVFSQQFGRTRLGKPAAAPWHDRLLDSLCRRACVLRHVLFRRVSQLQD
jgi:hypothetical protein